MHTCNICREDAISAVCLECRLLLCVNCVIIHVREYSHQSCDVKEAFRKVHEQARQLDISIRKLAPREQTEVQNPLNGILFEESISKLKQVRVQIESQVAQFFDHVTDIYTQMWNDYIQIWGSGKMMQDRVTEIQHKLQSFLCADSHHVSALQFIFNEMLLESASQIIESNTRRQSISLENLLEGKDKVVPPRLLFDTHQLNKIDQSLRQLVQMINWHQDQIIEIKGQPSVVLPIFPLGGRHMYIYHSDTREYQVGSFPDLKGPVMPYFSKTIFYKGALYIIGGADKNGVPMRTCVRFKDGNLNSISSLPKAKNPANLLAHGEMIYCIGGMRVENDKVQWTKTCEVYSIRDNKWMSLDDMLKPKPHQSTFIIQNKIYALGVGFDNIEVYSEHTWKSLQLAPQSINPFQFAAGFATATINENIVLLFGGKSLIRRNYEDLEYYTDEDISKTIYCFDHSLNQFYSLGDKLPGTGVCFGEFQPIVLSDKVLYLETPLSKIKKIHRWLQSVNVIEITWGNAIDAEVVQVLNPD